MHKGKRNRILQPTSRLRGVIQSLNVGDLGAGGLVLVVGIFALLYGGMILYYFLGSADH